MQLQIVTLFAFLFVSQCWSLRGVVSKPGAPQFSVVKLPKLVSVTSNLKAARMDKGTISVKWRAFTACFVALNSLSPFAQNDPALYI